jgi:superfamily I DNA/RNA helicase
VSNSDAHSPPALGREATVFDTELSYAGVRSALETGAGLAGTLEFFPEEGKYHLDGHRGCEVRLEPAETRSLGGRCPACGKPVTVGVLHRVEALADRAAGVVPPGAPPWFCFVQLPQVVGEILGVGPRSKTVQAEVGRLVARFGPELVVLQDVPLDDLAAGAGGRSPALAALPEAVARLRRGDVVLAGGYDGEYGVVRLFEPKELADLRPVAGTEALFELPSPPPSPRPDPLAPVASLPRVVEQGRSDPVASLPRAVEQGRSGAGGDSPVEDGALFAAPEPVAAPAAAPVPADEGVLAGLDPWQRAAAEAVGPVLVVAGPGTGKTRTLTHRIAHLVVERGVPAADCLAITFTRRVAGEVAERLGALGAGKVLVTTFHGLGLRILREHAATLGLDSGASGDGVRVVDEAERLALAREALGDPASSRDARRLLELVSRLARDPAAVPDSVAGTAAGQLARYRAGKRARGLVDLDDLLALPVALLTGDPELAGAYRRRWPHVSVDEYQDVDPAQYALLRLLCPPDGDLCAIGDPDQAIYSFRGADVGFFLRFGADFPGARTVRLARNYRSTPTIVAGALAAVAPSTLVPGRELTAVAAGDGPDRITLHTAADAAAEASFVVGSIERLLGGSDLTSFLRGTADTWHDAVHSYADIAVLYRTDAQSGPLVDALEAAGVPYQKRSHHRLGDQPGVRELLAVLRADLLRTTGGPRPVLARVRAAAQVAIDRAGGLPAGAIGADDWSRLVPATARALPDDPAGTEDGTDPELRVAQLRAAVELLSPLAERAGADADRFLAELALGAEVDVWDPRADRVSLLTLHAAKGLEFPVVFLVGCEDGLLPLRFGSGRAGTGDGGTDPGEADVAEERRLLFVGMTRARTHLLLSHARRRTARGELREPRPSDFLADIPAPLLERSTRAERRRTVQLRLL